MRGSQMHKVLRGYKDGFNAAEQHAICVCWHRSFRCLSNIT
jgi:hypothetical protein